jgi:dihydroorotate dehydrogenase electron transfer subunit
MIGVSERTELATVAERHVPMAGAVELIVHAPSAAPALKPGQFFQLAVGAPHTLLRRPYSAAWSEARTGNLGFIFNVVGSGSRWLASRNAGDGLDLLGPLGHGFALDGNGPAVCVAGGLGVAVFPGVVQALVKGGREVLVLLGARTASHLLASGRFPGARVAVATDDGSAGHHGPVVELLGEYLPPRLAGEGRGGVELFTCGPTPMLQALIREAQRLEIPLSSIQVALETPMGCGMGTCLGCAAPARNGGYLLTCQQGPCVRADRLDWGRMVDVFHA